MDDHESECLSSCPTKKKKKRKSNDLKGLGNLSMKKKKDREGYTKCSNLLPLMNSFWEYLVIFIIAIESLLQVEGPSFHEFHCFTFGNKEDVLGKAFDAYLVTIRHSLGISSHKHTLLKIILRKKSLDHH